MNSPIQSGLSAPLRILPNMENHWEVTDLPFDEAAENLVQRHNADGTAFDQPILDLRTWGVLGQKNVMALAPLNGHFPPRPLRQTAYGQLATRLGAPADFVRNLPAELQSVVLNWLLASTEQPISAQLRLRGDEVSALVSSRYAALDAEQLVEGVRGALKQQGVLDDVRVRAVATGTTDALRIVLPSERTEIEVGDVSEVGLDVSTSSVGKSAVHVRGVVYRLVCTNGMRSPESMGKLSFRHVGEAARLRAGLRDAVPTALVHARGLMSRWRSAIAERVDHLEDLIAGLRELTLGERENVEQAIKEEHGSNDLPGKASLYSVLNGITQASHKATPSRRLEMESLAGRLLLQEVA